MEIQNPKAWLPALHPLSESLQKYEDLLADLCNLGYQFVFRCWDWDGRFYQHSVDTEIVPSKGNRGHTRIELRVTKKYQSRSDVAKLNAISFHRAQATSPIWTKHMIGQPSSKAVANHALAGIKYATEFKPNMGFEVVANTNQVQKILDNKVDAHRWWSMPITGDIKFLNT
jgi:hypothetical protein